MKTNDNKIAPAKYIPSETGPAEGTIEYFYDTTFGEFLIWLGTLGAPILWLIQFQTNYTLTEWACPRGKHAIFYVVSVTFVILALATGGLSWWNWVRIGKGWPSTGDEDVRARTRLLAVIGMMISILFALLIAAQGMANFVFDPCEI